MSTDDTAAQYVSRAGAKLAHALSVFKVNPTGWRCADLGCSTGGFTDCLLQHGAAKVYSMDRGYGVLHYRLRSDPRVCVMERTDALTVHLPEMVQLVVIDCGWTRQALILPVACGLLTPGGQIISLIKPHYEAPPHLLLGGVLPDEEMNGLLAPLRDIPATVGLKLIAESESPVRGKGGNREFLWQMAIAE